MDFFTHLVVSAAIAFTIFNDEDYQRAFIIGGIAPDFDVLIAWFPMLLPDLYFLQHRGLIHTVFFAPLAAALLIGATGRLERISDREAIQRLSQEIATPLTARTILMGTAGAFGHLFLDVLTTWGVPLFYPVLSTRFSLGVIPVFDPVVTLLSTAVVILFLYNQIRPPAGLSFGQFVRVSRGIGVLFCCLVLLYGSLQAYTLTTQSPTPASSAPEVLAIYRWTLLEEDDYIRIHFVNQLTQEIEKSYSYPILTFNDTMWTVELIERVIDKAKTTTDYKAYDFQLDPESRVVYEVDFVDEEDIWEVRLINSLRDAQQRHYGFPDWSFFEDDTTISVRLD